MRCEMPATLPRASDPGRVDAALLCGSLDGGGAERVMIALANGLAADGHRVDLVLLCGPGPRDGEVSSAVRVVPLRASRPALGAGAFLHYLRRESPRAVLATLVGPNAMAVACARLLPASRRPRVVVREANTLSVALRYRSHPARLLAGAIARAAYPHADAIIAVSEGARADLSRFLGLPNERVIAVANPAPTAAVVARSREPLAHPWFASDRAVPLLVAAGRLVPKKGFDVLLEAVAALGPRRAVRLVVMGVGPEHAALDRQIDRLGLRGRAELAGYVDNPFSRLGRADLFVLSSLAEGMPNALLEAMACGCPVVATDCPSGPREILRDGRDGILVPPGDSVALAAAIDEALTSPPDRAALRARAADFDGSVAVGAYARVLGLGKRAGHPAREVGKLRL